MRIDSVRRERFDKWMGVRRRLMDCDHLDRTAGAPLTPSQRSHNGLQTSVWCGRSYVENVQVLIPDVSACPLRTNV